MLRNPKLCSLIFCTIWLAIDEPASADEDFTVVVNPRTGTTFLRNDTNSTVNVDGYLFVGSSNVFSTGTWSSLTDNATAGWLEGQATAKILSETNLSGSLTVAAQGTVPLGSPYIVQSPSAIGVPEPEFEFTFSIDGAGVFQGDLEFEMDNNLVLVVDPSTGSASLENQSQFDVNINSYVIQSGEGVLDTSGWTPLQTSLGLPGGWSASTGTPTRIAEVNIFGSSFLSANGGSLPLGSPIDPAQLNDETDLVFQFSVAPIGGSGGASVLGGVLFAATAAPSTAGDYNNDGTVDAADYIVWRENKDTSNSLPNDNMIGGIVGQEHFNLWRSNFGNTSPASASVVRVSVASPVPEPDSCIAAVVYAVLLLTFRPQKGKGWLTLRNLGRR